MAGQAHVVEEGLKTKIGQGTKAEQEAKEGPAEREAIAGQAKQEEPKIPTAEQTSTTAS